MKLISKMSEGFKYLIFGYASASLILQLRTKDLKNKKKVLKYVTVLYKKVKQSRYRPGVAQRVPGS
jgi:hypothetical protein